MNIDILINEFNNRKKISANELHKRYGCKLTKIKHLFFLRKIIFWRFLFDGKIYYELIPLDAKIINILLKKEVFSKEYVRHRLGLNLRDFRNFLLDYNFKLIEFKDGRFSIQKLKNNNDIPCFRNIEFCSHINQCYLSYKCKAAQRFLEKQKKIKEKING